MRIDSHHHLWRYIPDQYPWIRENMGVLRCDFMPDDLQVGLQAARVKAAVAVQARQTIEETYWLLDLARQCSVIQGVVGWAPIASKIFSSRLDRLRGEPLLRGIRHIVEDEPDGFLLDPEFNRGISAITSAGLPYDILVWGRQLPEVMLFVDRHPKQIFVLDHIGKPDIAGNGFRSWDGTIRELACRENVVCKLSGMVTMADTSSWSPALLRPYYEAVLEAFGPAWLMIGSDWPVIRLRCGYAEWWNIVEQWLAPLSVDERDLIEGSVAARVYKLASTRTTGAVASV